MRQSIEVKAFKNELRNLAWYRNRVARLTELIEFCYDMLGARVKAVDNTRIRTNAPVDKDKEYRIRAEIEKHERNRARTQASIDYVEAVLSLMGEETRLAAVNIYANGKSVDSEAKKAFISHNALLNRINREMAQAIKKEG